MKKYLIFLFLALFLLTLSTGATAEQRQILTSFHPIYILAINVFDGIDSFHVSCMTAPETGCLHDYQLMVGDMMKLSDADAFIICGAGMEQYLSDVQSQFSSLPVIDCSLGLHLLPSQEHHHEESADDEEEYNAHTWLDAQNAIQIVRTIADDASALFPDEAERIRKNADEYIARLEALDQQLKSMLSPVQGKSIVTFHEAFPYFANAYGLQIAAVITEEHEDTLSPAQLAEVIEAVKTAGNPPLFTEPQYNDAAAYAVAAETGAQIYVLDPLVTGEDTKEAYEQGMLRNAESLLAAFETP